MNGQEHALVVKNKVAQGARSGLSLCPRGAFSCGSSLRARRCLRRSPVPTDDYLAHPCMALITTPVRGARLARFRSGPSMHGETAPVFRMSKTQWSGRMVMSHLTTESTQFVS